jgi:hypothetical protein
MPVDHIAVIQKLTEKTEQGKVKWSPSVVTEDQYTCELDAFKFSTRKISFNTGVSFTVTMLDNQGNELFNETAKGWYTLTRKDPDTPTYVLFERLQEAARRSAFDVDNKLFKVSKLLDSI